MTSPTTTRPGKWEFQFRVKDRALATGVTPTDLGQTVRNAYFGAEVMRLQRGRHEVKLMVRYPEEERRSLVDFREIRVRTADGNERPITELAEIELESWFLRNQSCRSDAIDHGLGRSGRNDTPMPI